MKGNLDLSWTILLLVMMVMILWLGIENDHLRKRTYTAEEQATELGIELRVLREDYDMMEINFEMCMSEGGQ